MSSEQDDFTPAINRVLTDIKDLEEQLVGKKRMVNDLCKYAGRQPMFHDLEAAKIDIGNLRRDQFFGVPLATAVRDFLALRGDPKKGGLGAATVNEIFTALKDGGFKFDTKNDENSKRALRISLSKNTTAFTKVPGAGDGAYGLREWYPAVKDSKVSTSVEKNSAESEDSAESANSSDEPENDQ